MNAERTGVKMDRRWARSPGRLAATPRVSLWAFGLLLAGATAGVFLAGGPPQGSLGIFLLCAGAALTFCPPQAKVEWRLWIAAAALVGCGALAFLPESWFGVPAWRRTLEAAPAIHLPATITAVPWETGFWLAMLALSLLVGLFLLAHPIRSHGLLAFALLAATAAGGYAALAIYAKATGWHYPFASEATFGFFPNRNHTATLLVAGSLLALGTLSVALREGRWVAGLLAAGTVAVCVAALFFFSASRGGIVFLLVGIVLWFSGLGRRHRDRRLAVSFSCVLLAAGILFLVSGSEVRNRLLGNAKPEPAALAPLPMASPTASTPETDKSDAMHNLSADFRLKIYHDAFDVVRDYSLTGTGLGTFAFVFPQYRHASLTDFSVIHPESDWFMLTAEGGIPATLCLLALLALVVRRLRFAREHPYWPLRWGCALAVGAAALHGLVDVPLHRLQLGWWVLVIGGLAAQSAQSGTGGRSRVQHALFLGGGLVALLLGGRLVLAQWFHQSPLPPFALKGVQDRIYEAYLHNDLEGARRLAEQTIRASPLYDPAYFQLGVLLAQSRANDAAVDAAFKAQRLVEPIHPDTPFHQGEIWFTNDADRVAILWLDALARHQRILEACGRPPDDALGYYCDLLVRAAEQPDTQTDFWNATRQNPSYAFAWLAKAEPDLVREQFVRLATDDNFLRKLDEAAQRRFLLLWYDRGDRQAIGHFLNGRSDWQAAAWPVHMRTLVDARAFEQAFRELGQRAAVSLTLALSAPAENVTSGAATMEETANNPAAAFVTYWQAGNTVTARRVLEESLASGNGPSSAELWRLKAALAARDANWPVAWQALQEYIRLTRPSELQ